MPVGKFLRSVIPEDPFQLFFLGGVVCLVIAHGLKWWPAGLAWQPTDNFGQWLHYGAPFFIYLIIFSGIAGYFVCFWPGEHPIRRVICLVCGPAALGLVLMFGRVVYVGGNSSVLESTGAALSHKFHWARSTLWALPEGFHFTLLGLILIAIFTSRLAFGIASLPVTLPNAQVSQGDSEAWRQMRFLIFVLVGPLFLVSVSLSLISIGIPLMISSTPPTYIQSTWFSRLSPILEASAACGVVLCLMGRENRETVQSSIRWPDRMNALLAVVFPIGIGVLISAGHFLFDRALWAARDFRRLSPPELKSYFDIPDPYFLLLFFAAFFEEIVFRGLLQKRFIHRYGMYRGIFLVGIVWAAFHFFSDFSFMRYTGLAVPLQLSFRVLMCVSLSFVLGWLTLRSGSIIPAAIAHTLYNVLAYSDLGPVFPGKNIVVVGFWAIGAYLLFRYWPVKEESSLKPLADTPASESAL